MGQRASRIGTVVHTVTLKESEAEKGSRKGGSEERKVHVAG